MALGTSKRGRVRLRQPVYLRVVWVAGAESIVMSARALLGCDTSNCARRTRGCVCVCAYAYMRKLNVFKLCIEGGGGRDSSPIRQNII